MVYKKPLRVYWNVKVFFKCYFGESFACNREARYKLKPPILTRDKQMERNNQRNTVLESLLFICLVGIDGKHVAIQAPGSKGEMHIFTY